MHPIGSRGDRTCKTCEFAQYEVGEGDDMLGECRIDPPVRLIDGETYFPEVVGDEWCRKWERRAGSQNPVIVTENILPFSDGG